MIKEDQQQHWWDNNKTKFSNNNDDDGVVSTLVLDIYLIPIYYDNDNNDPCNICKYYKEKDILLHLADLAVQINTYLQQQQQSQINSSISSKETTTSTTNCNNNTDTDPNDQKIKYPYQWMSGGDGPVFGIHCTSSTDNEYCNKNNTNTNNNNQSYMIPHLRTKCQYGVCIQDEWYIIGLILDFFNHSNIIFQNQNHKHNHNDTRNNVYYKVAIECNDIDDGQILLIEGSQYIPLWVDNIGPQYCIHRCYITTNIRIHNNNNNNNQITSNKCKIQLIRPKYNTNDSNQISNDNSLLLGDALQILAQHENNKHKNNNNTKNNDMVEDASYDMEQTILHRIHTCMKQQHIHRTAVIVPQTIAQLLDHRPDIISYLCQSFVDNIHVPMNHIKNINEYILPGLCTNDQWVYTILPVNRTAYAMLRTVTSKPDWIDETVIVPSSLVSSSSTNNNSNNNNVQIKRLHRQCNNEATTHIKYSFILGIRLLAGIYHCLHSTTSNNSNNNNNNNLSSTERRVLLYWSQIVKQCCNNNDSSNISDDWIINSWNAGPNNSLYNISSIIKCPVYVPEIISSITPLTYPNQTIQQQILNELQQSKRIKDDLIQFNTYPPHPSQVDNEEWMWTLSTTTNDDTLLVSDTTTGTQPPTTTISESSSVPMETTPTTSAIDDMLQNVQSFITGTSTIDGVETNHNKIHNTIMRINSTAVMNILYTTLQSKSINELKLKLNESLIPTTAATTTKKSNMNDPFFSNEDYTLMDPSSSDDDDIDDDDIDDADDNSQPMDQNYTNIHDLMNAMDDELRQKSTSSRTWDTITKDDVDMNDNEMDTSNDNIARNAHVLSNLLHSLDASGGKPGPIRNILNEMGSVIPNVINESDDHDDDM